MTQIQISLEGAIAIVVAQSIVSAVLNGQRQFIVGHIEQLAAFFHVSLAMGVDKELIDLF